MIIPNHMRKLLLLTIVMMSVYNPSYAQEYQLKEIEEQTIQELRQEVEQLLLDR